jgi:hypothetical protein
MGVVIDDKNLLHATSLAFPADVSTVREAFAPNLHNS